MENQSRQEFMQKHLEPLGQNMKTNSMNVLKINSLEEYSTCVGCAMTYLTLMQGFQIASITEGILNQEMVARAEKIIWDSKKLFALLENQIVSLSEIIPDFGDQSKNLRD